MPACPKCSYPLTFLENRGRYKCAICSRLYLQRPIEYKEFRDWNKRQRLLDIEMIKPKARIKVVQRKKPVIKRKPLTNEEKKQKQKEYYQKNRKKLLLQDDKWRESNRKRMLLTNKMWLKKNKQKRKEYLDEYRENNDALEKQKLRLVFWRRKHLLLAERVEQYL